MAKTQTKAAAKVADKTPAQKGQTAPAKTRQVAAGTLTGGAKLEEPKVHHRVSEDQRQGERRQAEENAVARFAASQMSAPAAHAPELTEEQKKQQAFQAEIAELAKKYGMQMPAMAAKAPRQSNRVQQNGITRPASGTITGTIWDIADQISAAQHGNPALISQLKAVEALKNVNDHTIKTQYARWRAFHGIKGRIQVVQIPQAVGIYPALEQQPAAPAAQ